MAEPYHRSCDLTLAGGARAVRAVLVGWVGGCLSVCLSVRHNVGLPWSPNPSLEKPSGIAARLLSVIPSGHPKSETQRDDKVLSRFSSVFHVVHARSHGPTASKLAISVESNPGIPAERFTKGRRITRVETVVDENGRQSIAFPWGRRTCVGSCAWSFRHPETWVDIQVTQLRFSNVSQRDASQRQVRGLHHQAQDREDGGLR